jgi:UDP-glucose 4-epimerase
MRWLVTGGAGFIGSHFADRLTARGDDVVVYDNFTLGCEAFLAEAQGTGRLEIVRGDVLDLARLKHTMAGCDAVVHLAARSNIARGQTHAYDDFTENVGGIVNVLEAMRLTGAKRLVFSSTAVVYGEPAVFPTPENAPFPQQTSVYGASKAAGEAAIQAFCETFAMGASIFRFVPIVGERYTHGHIISFYQRLRENPNELLILGDGKQRKSFVYVHDAIDAVLLAFDRVAPGVETFNIGSDNQCEINDSARWIAERLGLRPRITYGGGNRAWVGDSPVVHVDTAKIRALGWSPRLTIREGIERTVDYLADANSPRLAWF